MSEPVFSPRVAAQYAEPVEPNVETPPAIDKLSDLFRCAAEYILLVVATLLPIWVVPAAGTSLGFGKILLVLGGLSLVAIVLALAALRRPRVQTIIPLPIVVLWLLVVSALVSGLLSGDQTDALTGTVLEPHTVGFLAVMAAFTTSMLAFQSARRRVRHLLILVSGVAGLVFFYHLLRFLFGPELLSFGLFLSETSTPVGGFNDLAIYAGAAIIGSLTALMTHQQNPRASLALAGLTFLALVVLVVTNVVNVWYAIGFFGLLLFLYQITRDTVLGGSVKTEKTNLSPLAVATTGMVCLVALAFIVAGDLFGGYVSRLTGVSYLEVRPSTEATINIAQSVYQDDAFLGVGPNRFVDAWRQHRDRSINQTIFWNTDFIAGSGYLPTLFVTTGLLGGLIIMAWFVVWMRFGYRTFLMSSEGGEWFSHGLISYAIATFLWVSLWWYAPSVTVLLLTALFTGVAVASAYALRPKDWSVIPLAQNRRSGFVLMSLVLVVIITVVVTFTGVTRQYSAHYALAALQRQPNLDLPQARQALQSIIDTREHDVYLGFAARLELIRLNELLAANEPGEGVQQEFEASAVRALELAERAVALDPSDPVNHALRGSVYGLLAVAGVPGAEERAFASFADAETRDPQNPEYALLSAQVASRVGDQERLATEIDRALALKPNYTAALLLSAQLAVASGNTEEAIATTEALTRIEPNNPTRFFQLGVLRAANGDRAGAITALSAAIARDPQYANARYVRALAYIEEGNLEAALADIRIVAENNVENEGVTALLQQLEAGETPTIPDLADVQPVIEQTPTETADGVLAPTDPESDLLTPVNSVPETETEVEATEAEAADGSPDDAASETAEPADSEAETAVDTDAATADSSAASE